MRSAPSVSSDVSVETVTPWIYNCRGSATPHGMEQHTVAGSSSGSSLPRHKDAAPQTANSWQSSSFWQARSSPAPLVHRSIPVLALQSGLAYSGQSGSLCAHALPRLTPSPHTRLPPTAAPHSTPPMPDGPQVSAPIVYLPPCTAARMSCACPLRTMTTLELLCVMPTSAVPAASPFTLNRSVTSVADAAVTPGAGAPRMMRMGLPDTVCSTRVPKALPAPLMHAFVTAVEHSAALIASRLTSKVISASTAKIPS